MRNDEPLGMPHPLNENRGYNIRGVARDYGVRPKDGFQRCIKFALDLLVLDDCLNDQTAGLKLPGIARQLEPLFDKQCTPGFREAIFFEVFKNIFDFSSDFCQSRRVGVEDLDRHASRTHHSRDAEPMRPAPTTPQDELLS